MNNRYQKGTTPKGASRKSAASAKPKRAVGSGQSAKGKNTKKPKQKGQRESLLRKMPDTPEYKQYRRLWWYFLGAAIVLLLISFVLGAETVQEAAYSNLGLDQESIVSVSFSLLVAALASVGIAFYLDHRKIRPLVREFEASGAADSKDKDKKDAKSKDKKAKSDDKDAGDDDDDNDDDTSDDKAAD